MPAYDNFRFYDKETNTNVQCLMFLISLNFNAFLNFLRLRNLAWDFLEG